MLMEGKDARPEKCERDGKTDLVLLSDIFAVRKDETPERPSWLSGENPCNSMESLYSFSFAHEGNLIGRESL